MKIFTMLTKEAALILYWPDSTTEMYFFTIFYEVIS